MITPIYSSNLSLSYHTSVFFIISLSEAVYLSFFGGMYECNIFGFAFKTHIHTHSWLYKFIIAMYMYVLLCKT